MRNASQTQSANSRMNSAFTGQVSFFDSGDTACLPAIGEHIILKVASSLTRGWGLLSGSLTERVNNFETLW